LKISRLIKYFIANLLGITILLISWPSTSAQAVQITNKNYQFWHNHVHKAIVTKETIVYKLKYTYPMSNIQAVKSYRLLPGMTFNVKFRGINYAWDVFESPYHFTQNSRYGTGTDRTSNWFRLYRKSDKQRAMKANQRIVTRTEETEFKYIVPQHKAIIYKSPYSTKRTTVKAGSELVTRTQAKTKNGKMWYLAETNEHDEYDHKLGWISVDAVKSIMQPGYLTLEESLWGSTIVHGNTMPFALVSAPGLADNDSIGINTRADSQGNFTLDTHFPLDREGIVIATYKYGYSYETSQAYGRYNHHN